jgi:hypothetical protein
MSSPQTPGWYPAPDGAGDQWWNGIDWSPARRPVGGAPRASAIVVPPTPTVVYSASNPAPQSPAEGGPGTGTATLPLAGATLDLSALRAAGTINARPNPQALYGLVAGVIAFFFNIFLVPSILAIVFSVRGLARANQLAAEGATTTLRNAAIGGLAMGIISGIIGLIEALVVVGSISISFLS